ncbi:MAG: transglutaminase family protein [Halioglobus sp.]
MALAIELREYTQPSAYIDSDHPHIQALAAKLSNASASARENAVSLYYWARDEIRYNPYSLSTERHHYRASQVLAQGEAWCVPKAILLAALCRAVEIPARLGFADVRNHLSTPQMRELMETDVFLFHGYTAIYLEGQWVKATPAFNVELCERFGLLPLEFDGLQDSIYHPCDLAGNRHMEYLNDRGEHLDLPFDEMMSVLRQHYPKMFAALGQLSTEEQQHDRWESEVSS